MRKLLGLLGLADVVYTRDFDGWVRMRILRRNPWGYYVYGISNFSQAMVENYGRIEEGHYIQEWAPYRLSKKTRKALGL